MNKKYLLPFCFALLTSFGVSAEITHDFEDGTTVLKDGWGSTAENVENPHSCGNTSKRCCKITSSDWGLQGFWCEKDLSKYIVAVDVFTTMDLQLKVYAGAPDKDIYLDCQKGKWTTVYADYTSAGASGSGNLYFGPAAATGTVYLDNIRFVTDKSDAVSCSETMVSDACKKSIKYSYGTLAIGGGGFVPGIIASGNTKIARTDVGGAYKWNASDCSWSPLTNFISDTDKGLYSIDGAAIDPSNEDNIYLLGGCQYFSAQKSAVLVSKDGGKSFTTVDVSNLIYVHGNGDGRNCGERIAVDPNNSNIVYCGGRVNNPLIYSEDGGMSWKVVSSFPKVYTNSTNWPSWENKKFATTPDENGTTAIVFDKSTKSGNKTQRIFVGISRTSADNVYVSEDGGSSWSAVSGLPTNFIPCKMKLDPDGNLLIAYSDAKAYGKNGAIYRYNPTTKKATDISPATGCAFGDVVVSSKDANKLVACTNSTWVSQKWDNGTNANGDIYWTSTDGGKSWKSLQNRMILTNNNVTWIPGYAIHWSTMCMDPNDDAKVSVGSGNGIFTCNNIWCEGTPTFYFDVNGLEETVALDMVSIPNGDLLSVIGDYTGFIHKNIHEFAPIHDPAPGTTGGINYYSKDPNVMMRVANSSFFYTTTGHNGWKSMSKTSATYTNPYYPSEVLISHEGKCAITKKGNTYRFFNIPVPGSGGLFYSDNNGSSWTKLTGMDKATHVQVDPQNDAYVYISGENLFAYSSDYGETYTTTNLSNNGFGRITIVPGKEGLIYAPCGSNGLKVTSDHGKSFKSIEGVSYCEAVGVGKGKTGDYVIYIYGIANDCSLGIYSSEDLGATWYRINDDAHQYGGPGNGQFIVGDWNVYGRFYMSTIGLGIIYGELASDATPTSWKCFEDNTECKKEETNVYDATEETVFLYPNPFDSEVTIHGEGDYTIRDILGKNIETGFINDVKKIGKEWKSGVYILNLNGKTHKIIKK